MLSSSHASSCPPFSRRKCTCQVCSAWLFSALFTGTGAQGQIKGVMMHSVHGVVPATSFVVVPVDLLQHNTMWRAQAPLIRTLKPSQALAAEEHMLASTLKLMDKNDADGARFFSLFWKCKRTDFILYLMVSQCAPNRGTVRACTVKIPKQISHGSESKEENGC